MLTNDREALQEVYEKIIAGLEKKVADQAELLKLNKTPEQVTVAAQKDEKTKIQAGSVKESKEAKDEVPSRPPTKEELAFLKDDEPPKSVSVLCRIRLMNSSERLHWLHRVKAYKLPKPNIIAVGAGKKTKNFNFPIILGEKTEQK